MLVGGGLGSALATTAIPLLMPEADATPWWAWVGGVAGLGLVAYSVAEGISAGSSVDSGVGFTEAIARDKIARERPIDRSLLLSMTAAPLVTMPLVYLIRPKSKVTASVQIDRRNTIVRLSGSF